MFATLSKLFQSKFTNLLSNVFEMYESEALLPASLEELAIVSHNWLPDIACYYEANIHGNVTDDDGPECFTRKIFKHLPLKTLFGLSNVSYWNENRVLATCPFDLNFFSCSICQRDMSERIEIICARSDARSFLSRLSPFDTATVVYNFLPEGSYGHCRPGEKFFRGFRGVPKDSLQQVTVLDAEGDVVEGPEISRERAYIINDKTLSKLDLLIGAGLDPSKVPTDTWSRKLFNRPETRYYIWDRSSFDALVGRGLSLDESNVILV